MAAGRGRGAGGEELDYLCERSAAGRVVEDLRHDALDVAIPLCGVEHPVLGGTLPVGRVRGEDAPSPLPLGADDTPHLQTHKTVVSSVAPQRMPVQRPAKSRMLPCRAQAGRRSVAVWDGRAIEAAS